MDKFLKSAVKEASKIGDKAVKEATKIGDKASVLAQDVLGGKSTQSEYLFEVGPLGFLLEGNQVVYVEDDGQAEKFGVQVGDQLFNLGGFRVPDAPRPDAPEDEHARHKDLVKRWLKEMPRPGYLGFRRVEDAPRAQPSDAPGEQPSEPAPESPLDAAAADPACVLDAAALPDAGHGADAGADAAPPEPSCEALEPDEPPKAPSSDRGAAAPARPTLVIEDPDEVRMRQAQVASLTKRVASLEAQLCAAAKRSEELQQSLALEQEAHRASLEREAALETEAQRLRATLAAAEAQSRAVTEAADQMASTAEADISQLQAAAAQRAQEAKEACERAAAAEQRAETTSRELGRVLEEHAAEVARLSDARERAVEHEQQAASDLRRARRELEDARRSTAAASEATVRFSPSEPEPAVELPEGVDEDAEAGGVAPAAPPPPAAAAEKPQTESARVEAFLAQERISQLERRCAVLQRRLDSRPVFHHGGPVGPIGGGGAISWEPHVRKACGPHFSAAVVRLYGLPDRALRGFTQRLLKRDAWLWVFYSHLIALYVIAASCYAETSPTAAPGPLDAINARFQQEAAAPAGHA